MLKVRRNHIIEKINWAILGTGVVANEMAVALTSAGKEIYSVGNRTHSKAIQFAKKYHIKKVYDHFEDIIKKVLSLKLLAKNEFFGVALMRGNILKRRYPTKDDERELSSLINKNKIKVKIKEKIYMYI